MYGGAGKGKRRFLIKEATKKKESRRSSERKGSKVMSRDVKVSATRHRT